MELLLRNVSWQQSGELITGDVRIRDGLISETGSNLATKAGEQTLDLPDHFIYPGMINAHDHLEMNLYPRMGKPFYKNYVEWSKAVYTPNASPVRELERVDIEDRLLWGGLKNLISGATTVVHHNPWNKLFEKKFPVRVLKKITWAHSLAFGKNIQQTFSSDPDAPFVIHAGEGTDEVATAEIDKLDALGVLQKNTVLIHAVGVTLKNLALLQHRAASVVWCPASNLFMLDKTAAVSEMKKVIRVTLGTDSTMSGSTTLLDEMRFATHTGHATSDEVFTMVTSTAAVIFNLPSPEIRVGCTADIFIAPKKSQQYTDTLLNTSPEEILLTLVNGSPRLLDPALELTRHGLQHSFLVNGKLKYTDTDVRGLKKRIVRKADESVLEQSPLWKLIG